LLLEPVRRPNRPEVRLLAVNVTTPFRVSHRMIGPVTMSAMVVLQTQFGRSPFLKIVPVIDRKWDEGLQG
jgi:hypothetical protein